MMIVLVISRPVNWNRQIRILQRMMKTAFTGWAGLKVHRVGLTSEHECKSRLGNGSQRDGWRAAGQETLDSPGWGEWLGWAGLGWVGGGGRPDKTGETSTSVQKLPLADELLAGWSHPPYRSSC